MERAETRKGALALIAVHNIVQNTLLNKRGYVAGNVLVSGVLVAFAAASRVTASEMGLSLQLERRDLRTALLAFALTAGGCAAALSHPTSRELLRDERAQDGSWDVIAYKSLVRFPIGTALFEELTFRGVIPALTGRSDSSGDLLSAGVFGLWHVIPTARALSGNYLSEDMTLADRIKAVIAGCAVTTAGGLGFSWLRRRSGSIALPWMVHSAFNTFTYLAGVLAWRLSDRQV